MKVQIYGKLLTSISNLNELKEYQRKIFAKNTIAYRRCFFDERDLDKKLAGIVGAREVGKTAYLILYLKSLGNPPYLGHGIFWT